MKWSALVLVLLLAGCEGSQAALTTPSRSARPPTPSARPTAHAPELLALTDLPAGFITRPLTARNLPSNLTGCPALERLMNGAARPKTQAEFFRIPIGPWIDEAIATPADPAGTTSDLAAALKGCDSVTVTEEGHRVTLALAPRPDPKTGDEAHAYRATGTLRGLGLDMDVLLVRTRGTVLLLTNASLAGAADPALTTKISETAVRKAA